MIRIYAEDETIVVESFLDYSATEPEVIDAFYFPYKANHGVVEEYRAEDVEPGEITKIIAYHGEGYVNVDVYTEDDYKKQVVIV